MPMMAQAVESVELTADTQRILLRRALKRAREDAGLQASQAARALDWSVSKIVRIEQGAVGVSTVDLRALIRLYGVSDSDRATELESLARGSRRLTYSGYREFHSETTLSLFAIERDARTISKYSPTFIPGIMQTRTYALALQTGLGNSADTVAGQVDLRMERQEMFDTDTQPTIRFVIGEAAVVRDVGGPEVMVTQLRRLAEFSRRPGVHLQLMMFRNGAHPRMGGAFSVLEFDDNEHQPTSMLYLENSAGESLVRDDDLTVTKFLTDFETIQQLAEPEDAFERILGEIARDRFGADLALAQ
ncbi:MAG: helix-turn-helix domain-containing protein [Nocardioides sp.]